MMLLPPPDGVCQLCGVTHLPIEPHNAMSLFYSWRFFLQHGRNPTWADAVAHCPDYVASVWITELKERNLWTETENPIAERWGGGEPKLIVVDIPCETIELPDEKDSESDAG